MTDKTSGNKIQEAQQFYASFLTYTQSVFMGVDVLDINSIANKIAALRNEIQHNSQFLLYVRNCIEPANDENYLASHAVRATVIAMIIGKHLKLPPHRLLELGMAAFLHDIGMFKLPPETYLNRSDLKAHEKELIYTHPLHSYDLIKSYNCPPSVSSAVLEHHEREDGSGYPRKLKGENISLYGKIIAIACSYEAISAKRPYKREKDYHSGMLELVKNEGHQYNVTVVKALVDALSIYPIGTYVMLSNGELGRVFELNPHNQYCPIVQVDETKVIKTSSIGITITGTVTLDEIDRRKKGWCSAAEFIDRTKNISRQYGKHS